jgi:hypothetical protein
MAEDAETTEPNAIGMALGFDWPLFQRGIAASFDGIKR